MVRCFLTGVEMTLEDALVLNRRDAHQLLARLHERAANLRRVIEQFAPLDEPTQFAVPPREPPAQPLRKKHRLVCRAVEGLIAPAYPEVRLFLPWVEYKQKVQTLRQSHESQGSGQ